MSTLLTNVGTIITSLVSWLGNVASGLISNPIFQIMLGVILFLLMIKLIIYIKNEIEARQLSIELTGSTDDLKYYRSLSEEEKEEYNRTHI